ncbi:MAG: hypothetical protein JWQ40_1939 [Segetibacter sp.]|nr:hypothetical protein [Segetibacter sp.]
MKSKEVIWTFLTTNKDFRDLVVNVNTKENNVLEKCIRVNPGLTNEIDKAREFIERMTFRKEELDAYEMDEMLENILSQEKADIQRKPN